MQLPSAVNLELLQLALNFLQVLTTGTHHQPPIPPSPRHPPPPLPPPHPAAPDTPTPPLSPLTARAAQPLPSPPCAGEVPPRFLATLTEAQLPHALCNMLLLEPPHPSMARWGGAQRADLQQAVMPLLSNLAELAPLRLAAPEVGL